MTYSGGLEQQDSTSIQIQHINMQSLWNGGVLPRFCDSRTRDLCVAVE
jgi:hypothetical protein